MDHCCRPRELVVAAVARHRIHDGSQARRALVGAQRAGQAGTGVEGEVLWLDEPHSLELTWRWDGEDVEDLVRVTLTETGNGTTVTVHHRTSKGAIANYRLGWQFVLGNLATALH